MQTLTLDQDQLQLLIDLLSSVQVQGETETAELTFEEQVEIRTQESIRGKVESYQKRLERFERINTCFTVALEQQLEPEMAKFVVENLDAGRRSNNYSTMMKVYAKVKDTNLRNMVKVASAIYRKYFSTNKAYINQMNSIIKFSTSSDQCSQMTQQINRYLVEFNG